MKRALIGLVAVLTLMSCSDKEAAKPQGPPPIDLATMLTANPRTDFQSAIDRKDYRFIGIQKAKMMTPGVDMMHGFLVKKYGIHSIEKVSDMSPNDEEHLNQAAEMYAKTYNLLMLQYLTARPVERKLNKNSPTPPPQQ